MTRLARRAAAWSVGTWLGVLGFWWAVPALLVVRRNRALFWLGLVGFLVGAAVGVAHQRAPVPIAPGRVVVEGTIELELDRRWGWSGILATDRGRVLVRLDAPPPTRRVGVAGRSDGVVARVAGGWVAATVTGDGAWAVGTGWHSRVADRLAERVRGTVVPSASAGRALLAGFLIGDTSHVPSVVDDRMRAAGLSHLTAVSGSNVALFLWLVVIVTAPVATIRTVRLALVLNGLVVFGFLTGWEPSVVRAAVVAAVVSVGRFVGLPLDPATALAVVAGGAVLVDPSLATAVGFQLSVLATAGLLASARWMTPGSPARRMLVATSAAQLAVAPVLIATFGSVPVLAPLSNLVAIPLVGFATVLGGVGAAAGLEWLVAIGAGSARVVAAVAEVASTWPQVGWVGLAGTTVLALAWWTGGRMRTAAVAVCVLSVVVAVAPSGGRLDGVAFLDVGQGDATLLSVPGFTMLVDGGPDGARLAESIRRHGVRSLDLVVATHVHADHVTGLTTMLESVPVGIVWAAFDPHSTSASARLLSVAAERGVEVRRPVVGDVVVAGSARVEVVGPRRRYDGPNDQSIVLVVETGGRRILLAGDIEVAAQAEVEVPGVDILKVPHQGAATSDEAWLERHAGSVSIVSVGPNSFGHPAAWVLDALERSGAMVHRTDESGDYVLDRSG